MSSAFTPTIQMIPLPAGCVLPYAGSSAPTGYVLCDGQELDKLAYPLLYAAILDTYATQINPTTGVAWANPSNGNFRVPDYRGTFLRGVGTSVRTGGTKSTTTTLSTYVDDKTAQNGLGLSTGAASGTFGSSGHTHAEGTLAAAIYPGSSIITRRTSMDTYTINQQISGTFSGTDPGGTYSSGVDVLGNTASPSATSSVSYTAQTINAEDTETAVRHKGVNYIISTGRY